MTFVNFVPHNLDLGCGSCRGWIPNHQTTIGLVLDRVQDYQESKKRYRNDVITSLRFG